MTMNYSRWQCSSESGQTRSGDGASCFVRTINRMLKKYQEQGKKPSLMGIAAENPRTP